MKLNINNNTLKSIAIASFAIGMLNNTKTAEAVNIRVSIENISPSNGVAITPVWVGFHDGTFDSYDGGSSV